MALWGGLQNRLQHLWGHRPPHAYSGPASGHDYRTSQVHSSWNPINHFDLAETLRDTTPADLIRYAHRPPSLLYAQNEWRRAEYYQKLSLRLSSIKPEEVGLESLLEARIAAAGKSTVDGRVAEMRAIRSVVVGLHGIGNEETEKEGWKTRKQARRFVAGKIGPLAEMAASRGDTATALEGFRALEDTGAITARQLRTYGEILSNTDAASDATSLRIYLQCLEQHEWKTAVDPLLQAFQREVSEHLSIHENTPRHVVAERMALIARMHAGGGTLNVPPKSLGLGYLLLEQPGRAVHYLERACEMDGHDGGETFFFLAQCLYRTDQWDKASTAFDRATQRGYPQSRIAAWQGLALAKNGQWDAAFEVFRLAERDLGPETDAMFFVYWARACYRMRAFDQAKMRYQQAIEKSLENEEKRAGNVLDRIRAHYGLSVCLVNEGDLDGAIVQLKKALSMRVKFAPASHLLGWLLEQQERRGEALQCYRAAVEANPGDLVYVLSLGLVLDSNLKDDALPYLTKGGGRRQRGAGSRAPVGHGAPPQR